MGDNRTKRGTWEIPVVGFSVDNLITITRGNATIGSLNSACSYIHSCVDNQFEIENILNTCGSYIIIIIPFTRSPINPSS